MLKLLKDMRLVGIVILSLFLVIFSFVLAKEDCVKLMRDKLNAFSCQIPKITNDNKYVKDQRGNFVLKDANLKDFLAAIKAIEESSKPYTSANLEKAAEDLANLVKATGDYINSSDFSASGFASKLDEINKKVDNLSSVLDTEIRTNPNGNGVSWGTVKAALQDEVKALGIYKMCLSNFTKIKDDGLACEERNKQEEQMQNTMKLQAKIAEINKKIGELKAESSCLMQCKMKLEMKNPDRYKK